MIDKKIEDFLEKGNMTYLYCLLAKLEAHRMNNFPSFVKQKFDKKITVMAMEHVASNEVPDYVSELEEAERLLAAQLAEAEEEEAVGGIEFAGETIDDSAKFIRELEATDVSKYDLEVVRDPFAPTEDDDDDDLDDDIDDDDDDDDN